MTFNSLGAFGLTGNIAELTSEGAGILLQGDSVYLIKIVPGSDTQPNRANIELLWSIMSNSTSGGNSSSPGGNYQPLSTTLTAIATLTTTDFGRNLLTLIDVAALQTLIGAAAASDVTALQSVVTSLGTAIDSKLNAAAASQFATAAQGAKADIALQPSDIGQTLQPHDADLDAIAALTTTNYGRSLLTLADVAALRTAVGAIDSSASGSFATAAQGAKADSALQPAAIGQTVQGYDADLDAIAQLATTSFGRSLLALADAAAARTAIGAMSSSASFATAAQGAKADTALQPAAIGSTIQAYDADLAAIAALATTSFGRSLLTLADAPALRNSISAALASDVTALQTSKQDALGFTPATAAQGAKADSALQPAAIGSTIQAYDADLAAIAALATTSYGRSFLTAADASAAQSLIGVTSTGFVGQFNAATIDFYNRIVANGGTISFGDLVAIDQFLTSTSGLPILSFSPLAGNNLNAAKTKLIYTSGESSTNLTLSGTPTYNRTLGFVGDGTAYFKSGFIPSAYSGYSSDASLGLYSCTNSAVDRDDIGVQSGSSIFIMNTRASNNYSQAYCWNSSAGASSQTDSRGVFLLSRSGSNLAYYVRGSQFASISNAGGAPPSAECYFGANNNNNSTTPTSRTQGCYIIGRGMTAAQAVTLTNAINALMNAFGRGVV